MKTFHSTPHDAADAHRLDRGSAMILTLMVMTLVTALSTTVAVVSINNLQSSWRSRQAGSALSAADAGVAQAVTYLRGSGVRELRCSPTCGAANPWGDSSTPSSVSISGEAGQSYKAWIEPVAPYPQNDPGLYRIHSTGSAAGAASRPVIADVSVTTTNVPKGVFARSINGGGAASVARESVFSTGCVYNRSKIQMVPGEIDLAYGIPIGVHSSQIITNSNGTGQYCPTTNKPIHAGTKGSTTVACNTTYPYDQDLRGARLTPGDGCHDARMTGTGSWARYYTTYDLEPDGIKDPSSLLKSDADLFKMFGFQTPVLSQGNLDTLRMLAQSQGNYWTKSSKSQWSSPDEANAVMFFDLTQTDVGGTVDLNDIEGFSREPNLADGSPSCSSKSLIIIVEGGNVKLNSNQKLAASLFLTASAPNGQVFKANGTSDFIGTIYADTVNLAGTANISMDTCFLANASPGLMDFAVTSYREEDRGLS